MKYTEKGTLVLDGKFVAQEIQNSIKKTIDNCGVEITLATVLVGDDKPSQLYVNNKHKQATLCSIKSVHVNLPGNISQDELESTMARMKARCFTLVSPLFHPCFTCEFALLIVSSS